MVEAENYKGIKFVRISSLPKEQSEKIQIAIPKEKIIKILQDEIILRDCIQYQHYQEWFKTSYQLTTPKATAQPEPANVSPFALALKQR